MGYNNNNAGMHMIRYAAKNYYDDLGYYDRLAEREYKQELKMKREQEEKDAQKIEKSKTNTVRRKRNKNRNRQKLIPYTETIAKKYFENTMHLDANIYLISVERKLDIYDALCECEKLCSEDSRMIDNVNPLRQLTSFEKVNVFLNLLADKMGCNVCEFILPDEEKRKKKVYRILDDLHANVIDDPDVPAFYEITEADDEDVEYVVESISLVPYKYLDFELSDCMMEYSFVKISSKTGDSKPSYVFYVSLRALTLTRGSCYAPTNAKRMDEIWKFKYMSRGSEIVRENKGKIADFFEELKELWS